MFQAIRRSFAINRTYRQMRSLWHEFFGAFSKQRYGPRSSECGSIDERMWGRWGGRGTMMASHHETGQRGSVTEHVHSGLERLEESTFSRVRCVPCHVCRRSGYRNNHKQYGPKLVALSAFFVAGHDEYMVPEAVDLQLDGIFGDCVEVLGFATKNMFCAHASEPNDVALCVRDCRSSRPCWSVLRS